jgi:sugar-specific transcriptional regulator TrmB
MKREVPELEYLRYWRNLQQLGLNAYEARAWLVLLGHGQFKALEIAPRAHVPRQKIYEVLDSLVEKGFAQVVQGRTKLFSAVEPRLALPTWLERKQRETEHELQNQRRSAATLADDLENLYTSGKGGRGTLDFLRIVSEQNQTAAEYRRMLASAATEYLEFSRPPYAVDPIDEKLVLAALASGVACRLLIESSIDDQHRQWLSGYAQAGVEIREADSLPLKLALFDSRCGLIALLDPVVSRPMWTSLVFDHPGLGQAMKYLFEDHWRRALPFGPQNPF